MISVPSWPKTENQSFCQMSLLAVATPIAMLGPHGLPNPVALIACPTVEVQDLPVLTASW